MEPFVCCVRGFVPDEGSVSEVGEGEIGEVWGQSRLGVAMWQSEGDWRDE